MNDTVINKEVVHDARWLKLVKAKALIRGAEVEWIYCTRRNQDVSQSDLADAVVIVPFVKEADDTKILVIEEFRVPLGRKQIGFPSGLIDPGEDVARSVERELREETGYQVTKVMEKSPTLATSAGLTDETFKYVFVEAEYAGEAELEHSESIEVLKLSMEELKALMQGSENFCGRVWSLCYHFIKTNQFPL